MKHFTVLAVIFLLVSSLTINYSCRRESDIPNKLSKWSTNELSIGEAKEIFNRAEEDITLKFKGKYSSISANWDSSKIIQLGNEHLARYIPIGYDAPSGSYLEMICLKDKGKLRSLLVETKPDSVFFKNYWSREYYARLDGNLLFYTVSGTFVSGFIMEKGRAIRDYIPKEEMTNLGVLSNSSGKLIKKAMTQDDDDPDPCEGNWGNFGCQELTGVVVSATPQSGGYIIFISIPSEIFYNSPTESGAYGGYNWSAAPPPNAPSLGDLGAVTGDYTICPNSFQFKQLTTTSREAKVWGIHYAFHEIPGSTYETTFGLDIHVPSDIVYNATTVYQNLVNRYQSRLLDDDLKLYFNSTDNQMHLYISPAAQSIIIADACEQTVTYVRDNEIIPILGVSTSAFKQNWKEAFLAITPGLIPGTTMQILNGNVSGSTNFKYGPGC
jgi:hypothetical protein